MRKLPVICTDSSGGSDIITNEVEGYIIPSRDIKALIGKIRYFYNNPNFALKMGDKAQKKAKAFLPWDKYGDKVEKMYRDLLKNT